jgi:predicted unusual protein kinase regulating ubiquinone biosynthesis (AarF/ABC1/UbiB family)
VSVALCRSHGWFHADPHPGNVAVQVVNGEPVLVYYDFGMMGEIKADIRTNLLEVFYGVYRKDTDRVLDALVALGVIKLKAGDRTSLRRSFPPGRLHVFSACMLLC